MPSEEEELSRFCVVRSLAEYGRIYRRSLDHPDAFWGGLARQFVWSRPPLATHHQVGSQRNLDVSRGPLRLGWWEGAETNLCHNALDEHVRQGRGDKVAYYWEGNGVEERSSITYSQLLEMVCKFANVLKSKGVSKGDKVTIYLPMVVEAVAAMLACVRIGAVHNVVFAGFSSDSLAERMLDCDSHLLITSDGVWRGNKFINLKVIADGALEQCSAKGLSSQCIVVRLLGETSNNNTQQHNKPPEFQVPWNEEVDSWWHEEMERASATCQPEWVDAEHPSFVLYTSGSTGKPKGVVHSTGGYMVYAALTFQWVFAHRPHTDVYFCTADVGWITGHTYGVYGPLLQGATSLLFQGIPTFPDPGRYWALVERYGVTKFYTAPTAIRTLMKYGEEHVNRYDLSSLEVLGSVGEPINPEAWHWYHRVVGKGRCTLVDTYWQSETGGHMITPLPGVTPLKPGSATLPFFGVVPVILDEDGKEVDGPGEGYLAFKQPWPGMMRGLFANPGRFEATYFKRFPGYYCSGDGCRRDADGYYWVTGRTDDLLNVSGHLLSTAEVESALATHPHCVEAAAVAVPHPLKGQALHCYVVLQQGRLATAELVSKLKEQVRSRIGAFACPEVVQACAQLPKTRSGKVLRRILRKVARGERDLGDTSTLADPAALAPLYAS